MFVTIMHPLFHIMIHLIFYLFLFWVLKWSSISCLLFVTILLLVNNVIKIHIVQMVLNSGLFRGWLGSPWKCVTKIWVSHERRDLICSKQFCITKLHNVEFTFGELLANARETKSNVALPLQAVNTCTLVLCQLQH